MHGRRRPQTHEGTIIPDGPNRMWGADATQVHTRLEGMATVFVALDHFVGDVVGIHAAQPGTRLKRWNRSIRASESTSAHWQRGSAKGCPCAMTMARNT